MRFLTLLSLALLIAAVPAAQADTCEQYAGLTSLPHHKLGLYEDYYAVDLQTRGNHVYMFDGGHLDCLNLENPWQIVATNYTPAINITPNPGRLLKIGDDHLYAWHSGGVAVIDISQTVPPVLLTTVPTFGNGAFVGETGSYGFFATAGRQLEVYDFSNPTAPQLVATVALPLADGFFLSGAAGFGHVYMLWSTSNFKEFLIYDAGGGSPSLVAHYTSGGNYPMDFFNILENLGGEHMFIAGKYLWNDFNTLQLAPQSTNSAAFDLSDPALPLQVGGSDDIVAAEADGITYGFDGGPTGFWLTVGNVDLYWNGNVANTTLTDRALVFTTNLNGIDYIVSAPRECDAPTIVAGSVGHSTVYQPSGQIDVTVTWRTAGWTDPLLDAMDLADGPNNPPGSQVGTGTRHGGQDLVLQADGTWRHTMTFTIPQCAPRTSYFYDVRSERTGLTDEVTGRYVKVMYCIQQLGEPLAATDLEITASPNPFNPETELAFAVPREARDVSLTIYGIDGRRVCGLFSGDGAAGMVRAVWRGLDDGGRPVPSGVYFARLTADDQAVSRKLVLLK